ncbi:MAG: hypothetical protein UX39_C0013G0018 [Candidatus Magasanikbacteria bacterium GW2011_GWA2_46_17]|uniref:Uncharacterized protein n=1 Tax=Candidatus Magasanikbacteria bacterium GW2011_GWA2_46_17 TaxID=1619042 RepID=A0A0G1P002_9BACT|nr:MAG: hypothetical protein UX39_C0013G0018 [Candidatus Magasanikbacteria bacterium GW2011_GWA2_46_17]
MKCGKMNKVAEERGFWYTRCDKFQASNPNDQSNRWLHSPPTSQEGAVESKCKE